MFIKLIQWNVWCKEKPENIAGFLKAPDADIICAQELIKDSRTDLDAAKYIAEKLGFEYYYHDCEAWDNRAEKEAQGNAIFSRFPIINTNHLYIQNPKHNPPNHSREGRVYVEIVVKIGDKKLTVGTTHLSYSDQFIITKEKKEEIDVLSDILKKRKNNYLFTGDLNSLPDSSAVSHLEKILSHSGPAYTQTTKPKDRVSKENGSDWRLDYIFNSEDISIIDAKILDCPYSDHLPVQIKFEF